MKKGQTVCIIEAMKLMNEIEVRCLRFYGQNQAYRLLCPVLCEVAAASSGIPVLGQEQSAHALKYWRTCTHILSPHMLALLMV